MDIDLRISDFLGAELRLVFLKGARLGGAKRAGVKYRCLLMLLRRDKGMLS